MEPQKKVYYKKAQTDKKFFGGVTFLNPFPLFKLQKFELLQTAKFLVQNFQCQIKPEQMKEILPAKSIMREKLINKHGVLRAVWIGHATVLIQDGPVNIITDPIFNIRVPDAFYGYKRLNPLPISIADLPPIHGVILSHDHHDHCNIENLKQLNKRYKCQFFAGKQSSDMFPSNANIHQMQWTQTVQFKAQNRIYKVHFVPTCHWSGRGLTDRFKRLWGGFVIQTPEKKKIYYPGDTGYCQIFKQIGQHFGQIDLSLIPIGAYCPRQFLRFQHIDPEQAVKVHLDTNTKQSLAIHWATFQLSNQKPLQPRQDLELALQKLKVQEQNFVAFLPGNILTDRIPVLRPFFQNKHTNQMTWFGHSSLLFQLSNINILINPVFLNKLGNKQRYTDFPCKIEDLPKIDIILINQPISEAELFHQKLSQSPILSNKKINSKFIIKQSVWQQNGIKIQLIQSKGTSSFIVAFKNNIFRICQNLIPQHINSESPNLLFLPLRPFSSLKKQLFKDFIRKYQQINPKRLVPINWGSFQYQQQNIIQPLLNLDNHLSKQDKKNKLYILTIGKTVPIANQG